MVITSPFHSPPLLLACIMAIMAWPHDEFNSYHIAGIIVITVNLAHFKIIVPWSVALARDSRFHIDAQKCERHCARYCGVFVCRGTLQLLCGGGDMVEAILMQCPPLPDSAPILLFPFRCDSCWDWLLGDHIPGTKRAQLVWTGLSDTTSWSGCESFTIKASLWYLKRKIQKRKHACHLFLTCIHAIIGHELCM